MSGGMERVYGPDTTARAVREALACLSDDARVTFLVVDDRDLERCAAAVDIEALPTSSEWRECAYVRLEVDARLRETAYGLRDPFEDAWEEAGREGRCPLGAIARLVRDKMCGRCVCGAYGTAGCGSVPF